MLLEHIEIHRFHKNLSHGANKKQTNEKTTITKHTHMRKMFQTTEIEGEKKRQTAVG